MKSEVKGTLLGIFVLITYILGFICLVVGGESDNATLITFGIGNMFFFPGLCLFAIKPKVALPVTILGITMLSYSISEWFGNGLVSSFLENNFSLLLGLAFFLAGLALYWNTAGIRLWKRHFYCTVPVTVSVVGCKERTEYSMNSSYTTLYDPTYQYNYNGEEYAVSSENYDNIAPISGEFTAYLNPNNPKDIVIPLLKMPKIILTAISLAFVLGGICCMYSSIMYK